MENIRPLTPEEEEEFLASHTDLMDALFNPKDVYYCGTCDGLRNRGHTCHCFLCGWSGPDEPDHLETCPAMKEED